MTEEVIKIMSHSKISTLSSLVSALHRSGWSPENTLLPTSFPTVKYTKIENIPIITPQSTAYNPNSDFTDEGSSCDDFKIPGPGTLRDDQPSLYELSPESNYSSFFPDNLSGQLVCYDGDADIELSLGSHSDIENWFDVVERNFEENSNTKNDLSTLYIDSTIV